MTRFLASCSPASLALAALGLAACASPRSVPHLASARVVSDFDSYTLHRVGLLPPVGPAVTPDHGADLSAALFAEFSARTDLEIVPLTAADLEAIRSLEPYRRGGYAPRSVLAIAGRYRLDALLIPTVTDLQVHPPQRLGLSVDLVSTETGQALWSSSVQLDAARETVRNALKVWAEREVGDVSDTTWELTLISPRRFARYAAYQVAALM